MTLVKEISVRDAILLCIEYGIKGAESQLESYDKARPNRLSTKNQIKALKGNLECIYENVEITGGGKKGRVILSGLKEDIKQKEDGRSENEGQPPSEEQLLINEYIHAFLFQSYRQGKHMEYGLNGWTKQIGLIDFDELPTKQLKKRIIELHIDTPFRAFKPSQIVREFKNAIYNMNTSIVNKSFSWLKKAGEIELIHNYNVVKSNGQKVVVDYPEYKQISIRRMEVLDNLGSNINEYNNSINNPQTSNRLKEIINTVSAMLSEEFDCKFIYESYLIISVTGDCKDIEREDFMKAYWTDFIKRTERRQRYYDNKYGVNETWFWRKLWAFNTLFFLEYLGIDVGGLLLKYETENVGRIIELSVAYKAWQDKDKPIGFAFNVEQIDEALDGLF